jgi:putative FmdB family regulatory protein
MPTYEYNCPECSATYELQESFAAESQHRCKKCRRGTARRVLHAPRIVFKGSGFYATDSRSKSTSTSDTEAPKAETKEKDGSKPATPSATSTPDAAAAS